MLFLHVVNDGHIGVAEYRQYHGTDGENKSDEQRQHHGNVKVDGQCGASHEFQEGIGGAQHLNADGHGQYRDHKALGQISGDQLETGSAPAFQHGDLVLLHIQQLLGDHEDEGRKQHEDGHLQHPNGDGDLPLRHLEGGQQLGKSIPEGAGRGTAEFFFVVFHGLQQMGDLIRLHLGVIQQRKEPGAKFNRGIGLHKGVFEDIPGQEAF